MTAKEKKKKKKEEEKEEEEDDIRFLIQVELMKNGVFDARMKIKKKKDTMIFRCKNDKKCVRIAYGSETVEK